MPTTTTTIPSRIAACAEDDARISGVAIAAGDVTRGLEDELKVWQADPLRAAADSLAGTTINPLHSEQEVGEVVRAGFDEDAEAVVYEARLEDAKLARQVEQGALEVSIEARHADGGAVDTERGEAMLATDIRFTGLSLVQHGAAPSASAEPGEAEALAAELSQADIQQVLDDDAAAASLDDIARGDVVAFRTGTGSLGYGKVRGTIQSGRFDRELDADRVVTAPAVLLTVYEPLQGDEWAATDRVIARNPGSVTVHEGFPAAPAAEARLADWQTVAGVRFQGTRTGKLDKSALDKDEHDLGDHYLYGSGDDKADYSYPVVDAEGYLRRGNVDAAWDLGCRGQCDDSDRHDERLLELAQAFDDPPAWAADSEAAAPADDSVSPERGPDEDGEAAATAAAAAEETMTNDDEPEHDVEALLKRVDEKDDRIESLEADLADKDETIAELEEEVEAAKEAYASALADRVDIFSEDDLTERFSVAELRAKVDEHDATLVDPEPDVQSGGGEGDDSQSAALGADGRERIETIDQKLSMLGNSLPERRKAELREEACDLAGVDEYAAATEVLD